MRQATSLSSTGAASDMPAKTSVSRYFKPESTAIVTTVAPAPSRSATRSAATTFAPVEAPAKIASSRQPPRHLVSIGRWDRLEPIGVGRIPERRDEPDADPSIRCPPVTPCDRIGDSAGSTAVISSEELCLRSTPATPWME